MGLVKFNCTSTEAQATAPTRDNDTVYFPTDTHAIYFKGNKVGGNHVASCAYSFYIAFAIKTIEDLNANDLFKHTVNTGTANLPPSQLVQNAAEYGDIDIAVQMFAMSNPSHAFKQVCEILWPNGTNSSNAGIQPTYEKWERIRVGHTWYDWRKVQSSNKGELEIDVYEEHDTLGANNIAEYTEQQDEWLWKLSSDKQRKIFDFVKNGGTDITFNITCGQLSGVGRKKASYVAYYSDSNDGMEHVVVGMTTNEVGGSNFYMHKLDITGFA